MKKVIIIHGWGGTTTESWFPWLKKELENKKFKVDIPAMPNPDSPKIKEWVDKLNKIIKLNEETYLIGHSIGCQAILRFLDVLKTEQKIKAIILVAPWLTLKNLEEGEEEIAKEWVETPLNFEKIKKHSEKFVLIYSSTDPYPGSEDLTILRKKLDALSINLGDRGHINGEYGVFELPELLDIIGEIEGGKFNEN